MVRPSLSSLNSLAKVLRQAQPLYSVCRSIINYLDNNESPATLAPPTNATDGADAAIPNNYTKTTHQTILELEPIPRSRVM
jgi:hypothetical protein